MAAGNELPSAADSIASPGHCFNRSNALQRENDFIQTSNPLHVFCFYAMFIMELRSKELVISRQPPYIKKKREQADSSADRRRKK